MDPSKEPAVIPESDRRGDHAHAEMLMLFEVSAENIRTFQERQTNITNLTALSYGGIVAYAAGFSPHRLLALVLLSGIAVFTAIASWTWLNSLQEAMRRARRLTTLLRRNFDPAVRVLYRRAVGKKRYRRDTLPFMRGVVIVGLILTMAALWGFRAD